MTQPKIQNRDKIASKYKWNAESVYPTSQAWNEAADAYPSLIQQIEGYQGSLGEGPGTLKEAFAAFERATGEVGKMLVYASMSHEVDTTDTDATRMQGKAYGLFGQYSAAVSFIGPELVGIGMNTLRTWMSQEPGLQIYAHYFENLFRLQAHVRSTEVEELLGLVQTPFQSTATTASLLTDADFRFRPALNSDGEEILVAQNTKDQILIMPDREARRTTWESYHNTYLAHKNTLANNLNTSIRQNVFTTRARRYPSTLEASLFENNIPVQVYANLIETFRKNLPVWHRYWGVRRKALGVEKIYPYDIWAPLTSRQPSIPFEQAVDWISAGLAPLGEEYVKALRKGVLEDRWVDVYPTHGKSSAQFSSGAPGTFPFICIRYDDTLGSMSTLAHELGHSMHSYLTWKNQPVIYSDYSLFVAEVASNFHQAMVRAYLFKTQTDPDFQINVIEEAMDNFHRYFFIMPTLARFELEMHQRAERGEGLTADDMDKCCADLFAEGFGNEMSFDQEQAGITWATFGHLYTDYYVYQYATSISAANTLSRQILSGQASAAENYIKFLSSGSSLYPLDALKLAGVDLTTPQAVEEAFAVLQGLIDRLERLTAEGQ
ncbi:MAG TPA: oligoendopeptidase F [Anaerolineaceae bacterium]|nr:oligoendopeptidase F [Anaerolineaceae bacterium]